jgi:putative hydrolase of the HAD superfamily
LMIANLGVSPDEIAYVGDRLLEDVWGPTNAGMHAVWINRNKTPLNPDLPAPVHQISSLLELPNILANGLAT